MIGYLKGKPVYRDAKFVILNTGGDVFGVGYKVYTTSDVLMGMNNESGDSGDTIELWIHTVVKDDAIDLYGFNKRDDLNFFELLLTVSGIGPKSALNILNLANTKNISQAIQTGDTSYLTKISGISKKIADKIVLELKGKVDDMYDDELDNVVNKNKNSIEVEALEALKSLGYTQKEAKDALDNVSQEIKNSKDIGVIIKATLKMLN